MPSREEKPAPIQLDGRDLLSVSVPALVIPHLHLFWLTQGGRVCTRVHVCARVCPLRHKTLTTAGPSSARATRGRPLRMRFPCCVPHHRGFQSHLYGQQLSVLILLSICTISSMCHALSKGGRGAGRGRLRNSGTEVQRDEFSEKVMRRVPCEHRGRRGDLGPGSGWLCGRKYFQQETKIRTAELAVTANMSQRETDKGIAMLSHRNLRGLGEETVPGAGESGDSAPAQGRGGGTPG